MNFVSTQRRYETYFSSNAVITHQYAVVETFILQLKSKNSYGMVRIRTIAYEMQNTEVDYRLGYNWELRYYRLGIKLIHF